MEKLIKKKQSQEKTSPARQHLSQALKNGRNAPFEQKCHEVFMKS